MISRRKRLQQKARRRRSILKKSSSMEVVPLDNNITLNNFCEFTDSNENKFWSKVQRVSSNLESGLGNQKFLKASDKYKLLLQTIRFFSYVSNDFM